MKRDTTRRPGKQIQAHPGGMGIGGRVFRGSRSWPGIAPCPAAAAIASVPDHWVLRCGLPASVRSPSRPRCCRRLGRMRTFPWRGLGVTTATAPGGLRMPWQIEWRGWQGVPAEPMRFVGGRVGRRDQFARSIREMGLEPARLPVTPRQRGQVRFQALGHDLAELQGQLSMNEKHFGCRIFGDGGRSLRHVESGGARGNRFLANAPRTSSAVVAEEPSALRGPVVPPHSRRAGVGRSLGAGFVRNQRSANAPEAR